MRAKTKNLLKTAAIYGGGDFLQKALGLLLIPIYTHYLTVSDYGTLSLLNVTLQLLSFMMIMGLGAASVRYSFGNDQQSEGTIFWANTTFLSIVVPVLFTIIFFILGAKYIDKIFPEIPFFPYWVILIVISSLYPIPNLLARFFQAYEKPTHYVALNITRFLLVTGAIIWFVAIQKQGVVGKLKGEVIVTALIWVVSFVILAKMVKWRLSLTYINRALSFGIPLIPHFASLWIFNAASRYSLKMFSDLEQVGLYTLAFQFAGIVVLVSGSFNKAWNPFFYKVATEDTESGRKLIGKLVTAYFVGICLVGLFIALFSKEFITIVAPSEYHLAYMYIPILVSASIALSVYRFFIAGIFFRKKTKIIPLLTFCAACFSVFANYFFIEIMNLNGLGAAIATFLSAFFMALIFYWQGQKCYAINFGFNQIALYGSVSLAIFLISLIHIGDSILSGIIFKLALMFAWGAGILWLGKVRNDELEFIRKTIEKITNPLMRYMGLSKG